MVQLSPKENYLRLTTGEMPDYVPIYTMMGPGLYGETATAMCGPMSLFGATHMSPQGGYDMWGVHYVANEETGFASIPEPNNFKLKDIRKWRDVVKAPQMPSVDWEAMAAKDIENAKIDRTRTALMAPCELMPFQQVMAFMGFNEGLCAMYEETDEVKEMLHYMADFVVQVIEKTMEYYKPDLFYILDDSATKYAPFISVEMYRDILKPVYVKLAKPANDRGIPIQFHNCGKCEAFIDDMIDFGVKIIDPAQGTNDLLGIKEKYKGKLALAGCWEWVVPSTWPEVDEEKIRQSARDIIDRYAPGGGYAFGGGALGKFGDKTIEQVNHWVQDEAFHYSKIVYGKQAQPA